MARRTRKFHRCARRAVRLPENGQTSPVVLRARSDRKDQDTSAQRHVVQPFNICRGARWARAIPSHILPANRRHGKPHSTPNRRAAHGRRGNLIAHTLDGWRGSPPLEMSRPYAILGEQCAMGAPAGNRHAHLTPALVYAARGLCLRIARMARKARDAPAHLAILLSPLMLAPPAPQQEWRRFPHLPHRRVSLPYEHALPSPVSPLRSVHKTVSRVQPVMGVSHCEGPP